MKKINFAIIALILYFLFIITITLNKDIIEINNNFKYNKEYNITNSNLILLFGIYAILIKNLINFKASEIEWKKILLYSIVFFTLLEIHFKYTVIFISLNILILYQLRKNWQIILLTLIMITTIINLNYLYVKFKNDKLYEICQKNISDDLINECVESFSYYSLHTDRITYLTYRNKELAKKNEKIKKLIEKNIIEKNEDENCKLNKNYEVPNIKSKKGIPCME